MTLLFSGIALSITTILYGVCALKLKWISINKIPFLKDKYRNLIFIIIHMN